MVTTPLGGVQLATLIATGEDSFTEFKESALTTSGLAKELCAFANAAGGRVLIGIDDDGRVTGRGDWDEERVMNVARALLDPPVIPTYQNITLEGQQVAVVAVDAGTEKPYAVTSSESKRYFIRVGSTSREASREELIRLTQASGAVASDLRPVIGAEYEDLDLDLISPRFAGRRAIQWDTLGENERRRLLTDAEILHRDTGGPTIAGLLCYGRAPQERLRHAYVSCAAYAGDRVVHDLTDRAEVGGRVDDQVRHVASFIERNLRQPSTIVGVERIESARPSPENVREIAANAVAHRDYGITGPVQVRVFSNRIEVASPGALPNGVTPDSMRVGISVRRNQFIMQRLAEENLVDALGRGFVLLVEDALTQGLPEPEVAQTDGVVLVTLWTARA